MRGTPTVAGAAQIDARPWLDQGFCFPFDFRRTSKCRVPAFKGGSESTFFKV